MPFVPTAVAKAADSGRQASVLDFGADPSGSRDSSSAFSSAIEKADAISVPAGTFVVGDVALRSVITLSGQGDSSVIRQKPGSRFAFTCDSGSPEIASNLQRITLRDLHIRGSCDTDGFSEFIHLVSLNGVSDTTIERVTFRGFRGDGLYLGSGNQSGTERHNTRVTVRQCLFDGINRENRNGISVIDSDGLTIEKCRFVNVGRVNMPGAIDMEPNAAPYHVVRNVRIADNVFEQIGGGVATVSMYISTRLVTMPSNIIVEGNSIKGTGATAFSFIQRAPMPQLASAQQVVVRKNRVEGKYKSPFVLRGVAGVELSDNAFTGASQSALIGFRDPSDAVRQIVLRRNVFDRCGFEGGVGVSVFTVSDIQFIENEWKNCGNGKPTSYAVDFNAGRSERVVFTGNRFISTNGQTAFAIQKEASHDFNETGNVFSDNAVDGRMRNAFIGKGTVAR